MSYEKEKRKNEDGPSLFWTLIKGLWTYLVIKPLYGAWWLTQEAVHSTWTLTKQIARGAWWLTKNGAQLGWVATVWTVNMPLRVFLWGWYLVMGLPPEFETQREKNIYRLIRRRYRRRNFFTAHTMAYALGLFVSVVAMVSIFRNSSRLGFDPFPGVSSTAAFAITWTIIWAFHLIQKRSGDSEDRDLHDALEHEYVRQHRKPKARAYEAAYYDERLAEEYESSNHTAEYYDDEDGYATARQR